MFSLFNRKKSIHEPLENQIADIKMLDYLIANKILSGLDCDKLPNSSGDFGTISNPIPVNGPLGEIKYLGKLRGMTGHAVFFHRIGSFVSSVTKDPLDLFELVCQDGTQWNELYFDIYHPRRSNLVPKDYKILPYDKKLKMDLPFAYGVNTFIDDFPYGLPLEIDAFYGSKGVYSKHTKKWLSQFSFRRTAITGEINNPNDLEITKEGANPLVDLIKQFSEKKFGEIVLEYLENQSPTESFSAFAEMRNSLSKHFPEKEIMLFIDAVNSKAYEKTFWRMKFDDAFNLVSIRAKESFCGRVPNQDELVNAFNIVVLNFACGAHLQPKMKSFINNSINTSTLNHLFADKDISEIYKWSIIFKDSGIPKYEMLGNSVFSMLGYYMVIFAEKGNPIENWELFLRFNENGKDIKLTKNCFSTSGLSLNENFFNQIESIEPNYSNPLNKEEIFINRITGESIKIKTLEDMRSERNDIFESLRNGSYEKKDEEMNFFKVLRSVFPQNTIQ